MERNDMKTQQSPEDNQPVVFGEASSPAADVHDGFITEHENGSQLSSETATGSSDPNYSPPEHCSGSTSSIEYESPLASPRAEDEEELPPSQVVDSSHNDDDDEEDDDRPSLGATHSRDLAEFARSFPGPSTTTRRRVTSDNKSDTAAAVSSSDVQKPKRIRAKTYCFYCEEEVMHFARHVQRHHSNEVDVQRILSMKKQSKERKRLLYALRAKGNYLLSKQTGHAKPVRTPITRRETTQPLPCKHCYGFFARKHLWRHMRSCPCKPGTSGQTTTKGSRLNIAQNMLLSQVHGNDYLLTHVFPRMHADEVTKAVKGDALICAFGARFAQIHQEKHQVNVVSRKMREMGKLLIEMNADLPKHTALIDLLRPENFDKIVQAVKEIAKYDPIKKQFGSPSYAMNISTSIKDCCQIACNFIRKLGTASNKADQEAAEFPYRSLLALVSSDWKFEISHNAHNDLAKTSMNKMTIVPLARDLRKFKDYLAEAGDEAYKQLELDPLNDVAFKNLVESVYCRVMLLCRKRSGELARLPIDLYLRSEERQSYEEFADVLKPAELVLARRFKRLVVLGKRRPTAVLFSDTVQQHISLIVKVRPNFVNSSNEYLFATTRGIGTLIGHRVLTKLAQRAQLDHPEAITTRALRKHLATVCQVLAMTDQDIEQLASFMGHTGGIHRSEYRLPDTIFQTAKVSKLLLMMESGDAAKYKGKSLDEIDVDMEADLLADPDVTENDFDETFVTDCAPSTSTGILHDESMMNTSQPIVSTTPPHRPVACEGRTNFTDEGAVAQPLRHNISFDGVPCSTPKKTYNRTHNYVPWTEEQRRLVKSFFAHHIQRRKAPKRFECEQLISANEVLRNKDWTKIKIFVVNEYNKRKRSDGSN